MRKVLLPTLLLCCFMASANVRLPKVFSDNMVLQRDHEIIIWGWADPKEKVTVLFNKQTKSIAADAKGAWKLILTAEAAGGPFTLTVKGKKDVTTINNVLVGDVWVCSGQSNMEWPLSAANDAKLEIERANFPQIRQFLVTKSVSLTPQADVAGGDWKACSPETAANFTAVGYFFARSLYSELHVPIGLINTSWGGTHSETWTSKGAFEASDEYKNMIAQLPLLNLEAVAKERAEEMKKKITALQGKYENTNTTDGFKNKDFDDSKWPTMTLPVMWEQKQLPQFDGTVWFRKSVTLTAAEAGTPAYLDVAMIDDNDITFVNGVEVGKTNSYNTPRHYAIPAGVLKEGKNVISVQVVDTGGGGGIYGDSPFALTLGMKEISLAGNWSFYVAAISSGTASVGPNTYPSLLYNAMLSPLIPYTIKGAIWYQGEANADRAYQYRKAFPLMISDWRRQWKQGDFPFYFVQLATFNAANGNSKNGSTWAELREAQTLTLSLPNTGMAVTTDIGNPADIHPRNKQDVGKRLAAIALNKTYGKSNVFSGPTYQAMKVEGNKVIVTFANLGSGLATKDKYGYLKGFEVAGADKSFYYAKAYIEGDHVVVSSDAVQTPVAVRFGWADNAEDNNLFNKEGFPAVPFRSDSWKGITEEGKFAIGQ